MLRSFKRALFCSWFMIHAVSATSFVEVFTIISRYAHNPKQVGEFAPISKRTGIELARFVGRGNLGKRYLEAGGGCGAVTMCIAKKLGPKDHLDVIEIDSRMCELLKSRTKKYANISVHCCSILDWHPDYVYDGIISTLPFNSLGIDFTQQAIKYFQSVANVECYFSYVEYPIVKQAVKYFCSGRYKKEYQAVQRYLAQIRDQYLFAQKLIYFNIPPIAVYHICFDTN